MSGYPGELELLAQLLRARVAERSYREALAALQAYCRQLRKIVAALPPGDPRLELLQQDWRTLWDETRNRVVAGRAHAVARLAQLSRPIPIYSESHPRTHTWACTG